MSEASMNLLKRKLNKMESKSAPAPGLDGTEVCQRTRQLT
jgi:hypothetical protein